LKGSTDNLIHLDACFGALACLFRAIGHVLSVDRRQLESPSASDSPFFTEALSKASLEVSYDEEGLIGLGLRIGTC
jgi:hypothetical protein